MLRLAQRTVGSKQYDVVIAGAGPAGSSTAIRLARAGRDVLLIEQKKFPREKLCGEFISPECLERFEELDVLPAIDQANPPSLSKTVFYSRSGHPLPILAEWLGSDHENAIGISRSRLDELLLERARDAGAEIREETTGHPYLADGKLEYISLKTHDGRAETVACGIAIDATGRTRGLSRAIDSNGKPHRAEHVAFKTHLADAKVEKGACELYVYPEGYGGSSEVETGLHNMCFIVKAETVKHLGNDPERIWRETMLKNPRANEALGSATVSGEWLAVPITDLGIGDPVPAKGLLSVGDAASFIDPFTGSGIALALESSRLAAEAILENKSFDTIAAAYRRIYDPTLRRRMRFSSYIRFVGKSGWVADRLIWLLSRNERLRKLAAAGTRLNDAR